MDTCTGKFKVTAEIKNLVHDLRLGIHSPNTMFNFSNEQDLDIFCGIKSEEDYKLIEKSKIGDTIFRLNNIGCIERSELKRRMVAGYIIENIKLSSDGKIIEDKEYERKLEELKVYQNKEYEIKLKELKVYIRNRMTHGEFTIDFYMQEVEDGNYRSWGKEIQAYYETRQAQEECDDGSELMDELNNIANCVSYQLEQEGHKVYQAIYRFDDVFFRIYSTSLNDVINGLNDGIHEIDCSNARLSEEYTVNYKCMTTPKDVFDIVKSLEYGCDGLDSIWVNNTFKKELDKVEKTYTVDDELAKIDLILKAVKENDKREGIKNKHENAETMLIMNEICTTCATPGEHEIKCFGTSNERLALLKTAQLLAKKDKANVVRLDLHKLWLVPLQIKFDFTVACETIIRKYTKKDFENEQRSN